VGGRAGGRGSYSGRGLKKGGRGRRHALALFLTPPNSVSSGASCRGRAKEMERDGASARERKASNSRPRTDRQPSPLPTQPSGRVSSNVVLQDPSVPTRLRVRAWTRSRSHACWPMHEGGLHQVGGGGRKSP
jgi:hypothetical protein